MWLEGRQLASHLLLNMAQTPFYSAVKTDLVTCFLVEFLSGCIEKPERVGGPHVAEPGEWFLNPTTTKEAKRTLGGHDGKDKIQKATRDGTHGVDSGTGSEVVERRGQIYRWSVFLQPQRPLF